MPPQPEVNSQPSKPWPRRLITDPRQYPQIPWLREERPRLSLRLRPLRFLPRQSLPNHRSPITVSCIQQWPPLSPLHNFLRLSKEITEVPGSPRPSRMVFHIIRLPSNELSISQFEFFTEMQVEIQSLPLLVFPH